MGGFGTLSALDSHGRVVDSRALMVNLVVGAAAAGEARSFVDNNASHGIGTGAGSVQEGTMEVDLSRVCRDLTRRSISGRTTIS